MNKNFSYRRTILFYFFKKVRDKNFPSVVEVVLVIFVGSKSLIFLIFYFLQVKKENWIT